MDVTPARLRSFISNIEKPSGEFGCWLWRGSINENGYGGMKPHRLAYEWFVGPFDPSLEIDHLCRTPLCVNPHHLEPVTRIVNRSRSRQFGPFELRRYCRRGHAINGKGGWLRPNDGQVVCRECKRLTRSRNVTVIEWDEEKAG